MTDPLFFHYRAHSELIRKYFLKIYIPPQSINDLYKCLINLGDSEKAYLLWKILPDHQLFDPNVFKLALNLQHPRISTIACNRLALSEARKGKGYVAKDLE